MSDEQKYKIHIFEDLDFTSIDKELCQGVIDDVLKVSIEQVWWEDSDLKYSLIKCGTITGGYVYGWLTQQYILEQHLYNESKQESNNFLESYEDRFFVLNLNASVLAIEWTGFTSKPPLNKTLTVRRLSNIFSKIFLANGISDSTHLIPFPTLKTSKEDFIDIFYNNRITEVAVEDFGSEQVPNDTVLVNPTPNLEGAMREIIAHDTIHPSISKLVAHAKRDSQSDLKKSAIIRGAIHSGQPIRMEYSNPDNQIKVRRRTEKGEISVSIPVYETDTPEARASIALAVINIMEGRDISVNRISQSKPRVEQTALTFEPEGTNG